MTDVLTSHEGIPSAKDNVQTVIDERIRQMQEKYDLLQYKVDGWAIWAILRFSIAYRFLKR